MFVNVTRDPCQSLQTIPTENLRRLANALNKIQYLRPPLIATGRLEEIDGETPGSGEFETLAEEESGRFVATGWARLPAGRPADAVLLAFEADTVTSIVFGLSEPNPGNPPSIKSLREILSPSERWQASFHPGQIPDGSAKITAWAFDAIKGKAYRLKGWHVVRRLT